MSGSTICPTFALLVLFGTFALKTSADWPTLRGSPDHSGYVEATLQRPLRLAWAREFFNERLGTAMEPIVAAGKLFVTTHSGNIYACDANSGEPIWRFQAGGPFLHSPAVANGLLIAASTDGHIY